MNSKDLKDMLRSIEASGSVNVPVEGGQIYINRNVENVIDKSLGKARIRPVKVSQFNLLLAQPHYLSHLSPFEIRCLNCNKVISYPAWHLQLKFDRNTFEYFVCFSEVSPSVVSLTCEKGR